MIYSLPPKEGVLDRITVSATRSTITNAIDDDYFGTVSYTAYDSNGNKTTKNLVQTYETVNAATKEDQIVAGLNVLGATGFKTTDNGDGTAKYTAYGAQGGSQAIKVTVSQGDIVKEKNVNISVKALPETAWNIAANVAQTKPLVTYAIEFVDNKNVIDEADGDAKATASARLKAMIGSDFAGYVRRGNNNPTIGKALGTNYVVPGTKAVGYVKAPGDGKYVKIEATANGDTLDGITFAATKAAAKEPVAGVPSVYDGANFKLSAAAAQDDVDRPSLVNGLKVVWNENPNTDTTQARTATAVLTKSAEGYTLTITTAAAQATDQDNPGASTAFANPAAVTAVLGTASTELTDDDSTTLLREIQKITASAPSGSGSAMKFDNAGIDPKAAVPTTAKYEWDGVNKAFKIDTYPTITSAALATAIGHATAIDATAWTITDTDSTTAPAGVTFENSVAVVAGTANTTIDDSVIRVNNDSLITDVYTGVKFGSKYSATGELFNGAAKVQADKDHLTALTGTGLVTADAIDKTATKFYVSGDSTKDGYFARPGSYSVVFRYKNLKGKDLEASSGLTVKNTLYVPVVTVKERIVDSLNMSDIVNVLKASVDLNNNTSDHDSIDGTAGYSAVSAAGVGTGATVANNRLTIKYVAVTEDGITFYVPINATFRTE